MNHLLQWTRSVTKRLAVTLVVASAVSVVSVASATDIFAGAYLEKPAPSTTTINTIQEVNDLANTSINNLDTSVKESPTGELKDFPVRHVVIINLDENNKSKFAAMAQFMRERLNNELKYPYYETVTYNKSTVNIKNTANLAAIAKEYNADIVIVPQVLENDYVQYYPTNPMIVQFQDTELLTRAAISGAITYYNAQNGAYGSVSKSYYKNESYLSVPSQKILWGYLMDTLLNKLPYKRVPTDINRYGKSDTSAKSFTQVEQPKVTDFSLVGVSEL